MSAFRSEVDIGSALLDLWPRDVLLEREERRFRSSCFSSEILWFNFLSASQVSNFYDLFRIRIIFECFVEAFVSFDQDSYLRFKINSSLCIRDAFSKNKKISILFSCFLKWLNHHIWLNWLIQIVLPNNLKMAQPGQMTQSVPMILLPQMWHQFKTCGNVGFHPVFPSLCLTGTEYFFSLRPFF